MYRAAALQHRAQAGTLTVCGSSHPFPSPPSTPSCQQALLHRRERDNRARAAQEEEEQQHFSLTQHWKKMPKLPEISTISKLLWADPSKIVPYKSIPDNVPFTQRCVLIVAWCQMKSCNTRDPAQTGKFLVTRIGTHCLLIALEKLFQHYPVLDPLYTQYEKNFYASTYVKFAQDTWPVLPLALCGVYALMIILGTKVMASRPKHEWKTALACWNLMLSIFSFCGMVRTVPHLVHNVVTLPFKDTICRHPAETYGEGACGMWVMLFIFSKVPELVDTVFIVFRKSKLQFLHWYHHITVLLFCWHSYAVTSSTGLYFVAMNYSVHAIMYAYYYLTAVGAWPLWIPPSIITVAQISQMIVGVGICASSFYFLYTDPKHCQVKHQNVYAGALMYGSYLYLFCDFFVRRFLRGGKPRVGEEKSAVLTMAKKIKAM